MLMLSVVDVAAYMTF